MPGPGGPGGGHGGPGGGPHGGPGFGGGPHGGPRPGPGPGGPPPPRWHRRYGYYGGGPGCGGCLFSFLLIVGIGIAGVTGIAHLFI